MQNAPREHSAIPSTFIKVRIVFKTFIFLFLSDRLRQVLLYLTEEFTTHHQKKTMVETKKIEKEIQKDKKTGLNLSKNTLSNVWYRLIGKGFRLLALMNFSGQFIKIISQYKTIGYNINVLQQTACLVVNPITVGNFAFLFNWHRWVGLQTLWWFRLKYLSIDEMVGAWYFGCLSGPIGVYLMDFFCSGIQFYLLLSPYLCFISLLCLDLYVLGDDALIS